MLSLMFSLSLSPGFASVCWFVIRQRLSMWWERWTSGSLKLHSWSL